LAKGLDQQKLLVECGSWPLFRFDPRRANSGENPLMLDSAAPKVDLSKFTANETRFRVVEQMDPARFKTLQHHAQDWVTRRFSVYEQLAKMAFPVVKS
jgi:pyruvate-ferredoxin/flavodoxin oxidoreductase